MRDTTVTPRPAMIITAIGTARHQAKTDTLHRHHATTRTDTDLRPLGDTETDMTRAALHLHRAMRDLLRHATDIRADTIPNRDAPRPTRQNPLLMAGHQPQQGDFRNYTILRYESWF